MKQVQKVVVMFAVVIGLVLGGRAWMNFVENKNAEYEEDHTSVTWMPIDYGPVEENDSPWIYNMYDGSVTLDQEWLDAQKNWEQRENDQYLQAHAQMEEYCGKENVWEGSGYGASRVFGCKDYKIVK